MRAVTWAGKRRIEVRDVPDPVIQQPTDAVVRVTCSGVCGSDLHLYDKLWPVMHEGDVIGHEAVGVVEEVGPAVERIAPGDRVAVPFNIACGECLQCRQGLHSQCLATQNRLFRKGGSIYGYTVMYGEHPGAQAEYLRVPYAHFGPVPAPEGVSDERLVLLTDVLPTAWQGVAYADVPEGGTVGVWGLGPIGQLAARIALHRGAAAVLGVDQVPARLAMAERHGVRPIDFSSVGDVREAMLDLTEGLGVDSAIDAVGMEAAGSWADSVLQAAKVQPDKLLALHQCLGSVRRGGTVSILGVYGGWMPRFPLGDVMDRQLTIRAGQANVRRWTDELLPLLTAPDDPLGLDDLVTHVVPLEAAPSAYEMFQSKEDGAVKVLLRP